MSSMIPRLAVRFGLVTSILVLILFGSAGTFRWTNGWVYLALYVTLMAWSIPFLLRRSPDLLDERTRLKPGAKKWDIPLAMSMAYLPAVVACVAGLDHRMMWPPELPMAFTAVGVVAAVLGYGLAVWAMGANRFFSAVIRIQEDRGHHTIDKGPYAFVRHPGYVGVLLFGLSSPLILASAWAAVPALLVLPVTVVRTALEDRTLQRELVGYVDYSQRVRYRLIPGIW